MTNYEDLTHEDKQNALSEAFNIMNAPNIQDTTDHIRNWGIYRELDSADPNKQMLKLGEEYGELCRALAKDRQTDAKDAIGDMFVVLTNLSMQIGSSIEECAALAYNEIKDRKGKMVNGVFVKESDLPTERAE